MRTRGAMLLAALLALAACTSGPRAHALRGGDPTVYDSIPVPVGKTVVYGAVVVHAVRSPVQLVDAQLLRMRDQGTTAPVAIGVRAVGPERGGRNVTAGSPSLLRGALGSTGLAIAHVSVTPSAPGQADYGTEILFELTPSQSGMYFFDRARVTYEVGGRRESVTLPAQFLLCAGHVDGPCDSHVLSEVTASR